MNIDCKRFCIESNRKLASVNINRDLLYSSKGNKISLFSITNKPSILIDHFDMRHTTQFMQPKSKPF